MTRQLPPAIRDALDHLLEVASRDTGQSRHCSNFLLSWGNAERCGGWNPVERWGLDLALRADILRMVAYLATPDAMYPDNLGYKDAIRRPGSRLVPASHGQAAPMSRAESPPAQRSCRGVAG